MTLLGFRAENHPQQTAARGPLDHVDDRRTPPELFDALHAEFGFTLDAAASAENAKLPRFYDYQANGLAQSWKGERVWCNPPYSSVGPWVEKAWAEMRDGCELVVMILPANRTEQRFWQDHVEPFRDGGRDRSQRGGGHRIADALCRAARAVSLPRRSGPAQLTQERLGAADMVTLTTHFIGGRLRMPSPRISVPAKGDRPPFGCVLLAWNHPHALRNSASTTLAPPAQP
jgi:phage N-6-adenine-methyltransferase